MKWILIFSLISASMSLQGQQSIAGRVVDAASGEGLMGAHIYYPEDWQNGVIAGLDGAFSIKLPNRASEVIVTHVGYKEYLGPVPKKGIIKLEPVVIKTNEVIVTAAPLVAEEFQYDKIGKIEVYTNPAAKADPILAVNSLPSSTTTDESANISLRGSSAIETGTFLNNVPIYDAVRYSQLNGIGTFSIFNTSIIRDVTVFPGNPPLEFGSATSGVISLRTDENQLEGSANSAILSLANVGFSREQRINDTQSLKVFSNWQPSAAMKLVNNESLEDIANFESGDLGIYWYGATGRISWKVLNYSLLEGYQFKFRHPSFTGIFDQQKARTFLISSLDFKLKRGTLSLNKGVSGSNGSYSYSNVAFETKSRDLFLGLNYLLLSPKWSIKGGLSLDRRKNSTEGNFHSVGYALAPFHPTVDFTASDQIMPIEAFAYGKYFLTEEITVGTGLRKNVPHGDQKSYLSRQLNVSYRKDRLKLIAGLGKYYKLGFLENSDNSFFAQSRQASIDVMYDWKKSEVSVSYFTKNATLDELNYQVQGLELFGKKQFGKKISASASVTMIDAESDSEENYLYNINYFLRASAAYRTRDFWTVELLSTNRQGILSDIVTRASFDEDLAVYQPTEFLTTRLPNYFDVGVSVSKMFFLEKERTLLVFASCNNLLDHRNVRSYNYSDDYSFRTEQLFSQRTGYLGFVINF
ncbi:MAG: TonB-dependent receptor [Bacteroidota bacterium]